MKGTDEMGITYLESIKIIEVNNSYRADWVGGTEIIEKPPTGTIELTFKNGSRITAEGMITWRHNDVAKKTESELWPIEWEG